MGRAHEMRVCTWLRKQLKGTGQGADWAHPNPSRFPAGRGPSSPSSFTLGLSRLGPRTTMAEPGRALDLVRPRGRRRPWVGGPPGGVTLAVCLRV